MAAPRQLADDRLGVAGVDVFDVHQRERLAQPRRDDAGITRRQLQQIGDLRQQLRRRSEIFGIEGEANVTTWEPVLVLGIEPVHQIRLADARHARNHHRPAAAIFREQIGGKLLQVRLAADEHVLDPRVRAGRHSSQAARLALLRRQRLRLAEHRLQHARLGGQQRSFEQYAGFRRGGKALAGASR
jgi:hypothetical protein